MRGWNGVILSMERGSINPDRSRIPPMHVILWRFRARPGREAEFEAAYGDDGVWVRLFRTGQGFLGSRADARNGRDVYLTIDRWVSEDAYRSVSRSAGRRATRRSTPAAQALTTEETLLGAVEA